jgi:hypothetical protein
MTFVDNPVFGGALMAGTLLIAGYGCPSAAADTDDSIPVPAVQSVRLDQPPSGQPDAPVNATVTFTDNAENDTGYLIEIREKTALDNIVNTARVLSVPGVGRVATQVVAVGPNPLGQSMCADVIAVVDDDQSRPSPAVCSDPTKPRTDLALQNIRGKDEQEWNNVKSIEPAYLVLFSNPGGNEATDVVVDIATSGVATLGDQSIVKAGWDSSGFTCATRPPTGGENAGLQCTGGHLAPGEQANPGVIIKFTGPGYGTIHASVSGPGDTNASNNGTAFNIRVY